MSKVKVTRDKKRHFSVSAACMLFAFGKTFLAFSSLFCFFLVMVTRSSESWRPVYFTNPFSLYFFIQSNFADTNQLTFSFLKFSKLFHTTWF